MNSNVRDRPSGSNSSCQVVDQEVKKWRKRVVCKSNGTWPRANIPWTILSLPVHHPCTLMNVAALLHTWWEILLPNPWLGITERPIYVADLFARNYSITRHIARCARLKRDWNSWNVTWRRSDSCFIYKNKLFWNFETILEKIIFRNNIYIYIIFIHLE